MFKAFSWMWKTIIEGLGLLGDSIHTFYMSSSGTLTATFSCEASHFHAASVPDRRIGFIFSNPKFDLGHNPGQQSRKKKPFRKPKGLK